MYLIILSKLQFVVPVESSIYRGLLGTTMTYVFILVLQNQDPQITLKTEWCKSARLWQGVFVWRPLPPLHYLFFFFFFNTLWSLDFCLDKWVLWLLQNVYMNSGAESVGTRCGLSHSLASSLPTNKMLSCIRNTCLSATPQPPTPSRPSSYVIATSLPHTDYMKTCALRSTMMEFENQQSQFYKALWTHLHNIHTTY